MIQGTNSRRSQAVSSWRPEDRGSRFAVKPHRPSWATSSQRDSGTIFDDVICTREMLSAQRKNSNDVIEVHSENLDRGWHPPRTLRTLQKPQATLYGRPEPDEERQPIPAGCHSRSALIGASILPLTPTLCMHLGQSLTRGYRCYALCLF